MGGGERKREGGGRERDHKDHEWGLKIVSSLHSYALSDVSSAKEAPRGVTRPQPPHTTGTWQEDTGVSACRSTRGGQEFGTNYFNYCSVKISKNFETLQQYTPGSTGFSLRAEVSIVTSRTRPNTSELTDVRAIVPPHRQCFGQGRRRCVTSPVRRGTTVAAISSDLPGRIPFWHVVCDSGQEVERRVILAMLKGWQFLRSSSKITVTLQQ